MATPQWPMGSPRLAVLCLAAALLVPGAGARAQQVPLPSPGAPAEPELASWLLGRAILPAGSFVAAPADAPDALRTSGKFLNPERQRTQGIGLRPAPNTLSAVPGHAVESLSTPFAGQPVQGLSGLASDGDGAFLALSDNGFGGKANSPDAMLMVHRLAPDFARGTVTRQETIFLRDPDFRLPYPIAMEGTRERYLTGSDLDPESLQKVGDSLWIGDEFGPFLVETDLAGRVKAIFETRIDARVVRSPDHPALALPSTPGGKMPDFAVARSKGFEGLALSADGTRLHPILEGPLADLSGGARETLGPAAAVRILEFDLAARAWTARSWLYPLAAPTHAIGDFILLDARRGLVIERDHRQGSEAHACREPRAGGPCFAAPARYKRLVLIELPDAGAGEPVRRLGAVDLLAIADPDGKAGKDGAQARFAMPFVTIEGLAVIAPGRVVVANDNNLPLTAGRAPGVADDTELVLLEIPELAVPP